MGEPSMKLFRIFHGALAQIVAMLIVGQQLALRCMCKGARDLTAGAARAVRALFRLPQSPSSVVAYPPSNMGGLGLPIGGGDAITGAATGELGFSIGGGDDITCAATGGDDITGDDITCVVTGGDNITCATRGGDDITGAATGEASMGLFDIPYDVLPLIIGRLSLAEQMSLRPMCRGARDLTASAAMAVRIAHALFPFPQPRSNLHHPSPSQTIKLTFFTYMQSGECVVQLHLQRRADTSYGQTVVLTRALISCSGFTPSTPIAVDVDLVSETFIPSPMSRKVAETVWAERGGESEDWGLVFAYLNKETVSEEIKGGWEKDKVTMRFEVSAKGDVSAVSVGFHEGLAERRAGLVGKVLGEVLKGVDASKASLLTQCFAECEDPGKAGLLSQGFAKCEGVGKASLMSPSNEVESKPCGEALEMCFEESGVRVVTRPRPAPQNMQVDLTVL